MPSQIADTDPLLKILWILQRMIILSFWGMCRWKSFCAILEEKYHEAEIKEPTVIYMERPLRKAEYTIHIEVRQIAFLGFCPGCP